ncbi:MAG TPA: DUF3566 domain-containing protein [Egibacteraceae bacterium]|nr:DUF3566 domain-containing protein [Egibacteraceae bacterium]
MSAAPREGTRPARPPNARPAGASDRPTTRRQMTIRKVDPWSVLKLSVLFYFCALLVVMLALAVFWNIVNRIGIIESVTSFMETMHFELNIYGGNIGRAIFLIGLLNVVLWSGINVFVAFLYNLLADLVGGLKITVAEDER